MSHVCLFPFFVRLCWEHLNFSLILIVFYEFSSRWQYNFREYLQEEEKGIVLRKTIFGKVKYLLHYCWETNLPGDGSCIDLNFSDAHFSVLHFVFF